MARSPNDRGAPKLAPVNRIERIFTELRAAQRRALMPFVCGGHPEKGTTSLVLPALEAAGASIVEVGIPFSDPIADGPVIASAMQEALRRGTTPGSVFDEVKLIRDHLDIGLVAMVSASIVHRMGGPEGFASRASNAGFDGVIYPDVPLEEAEPYVKGAAEFGLTASLLIAPTTTAARAEQIVKACSGFVYLMARTGITGEREGGNVPDIGGRVQRLRQMTSLPIACGFGISTAEQVKQVTRSADAAIVGSAVVRRMSEAASKRMDAASAAAEYVRELSAGLSTGPISSGPSSSGPQQQQQQPAA